MPSNTSETQNTMIIGIIVTVIMTFLVIWIAHSRFLAHFSFPVVFFLFGLVLAFIRGTQLMKGETDWRFLAIFGLLLVLGSYMINLHNINHAWNGALVLILAFLLDAGYSVYMWQNNKAQMEVWKFGAGLVADVGLVGMLLHAMMSK